MKVRVVKGYDVSRIVDNFLLLEDDLPRLEERYMCDECETIYKDEDEAKECCKE